MIKSKESYYKQDRKYLKAIGINIKIIFIVKLFKKCMEYVVQVEISQC